MTIEILNFRRRVTAIQKRISEPCDERKEIT